MSIKIKLTVELVPATCFFSNVRSQVSAADWDILRRATYKLANYICEICGDTGSNQGFKHSVEAHEIWEYTEGKGKKPNVQKLTGLIALCPRCHKVKHIGLATMRGEDGLCVKHLMKVNQWSKAQAEQHIDAAWDVWDAHSEMEWVLDLSWLDDKGVTYKLPTNAERAVLARGETVQSDRSVNHQ